MINPPFLLIKERALSETYHLHGPCNLRKNISVTIQLKGLQGPGADRAMSLWSSCLCCWSSVAIACCACCCIVCTKSCMCWNASICNRRMVVVRTMGVKEKFARERQGGNKISLNAKNTALFSFKAFYPFI